MVADRVKMSLEGVDGNAFQLMGAFQANARQQGWDDQAIKAVIGEAIATNYDHLLETLTAHIEPPDQG